MQSPHADPREVWTRIPEHNRRTIRAKNLRVYYADMVKIAREVASVADLQMRMQGIVLLGAFLKLTPYAAESQMTDEQVYEGVEKALRKYFGKRGDRVVQDNLTCVKRGYARSREIPARSQATPDLSRGGVRPARGSALHLSLNISSVHKHHHSQERSNGFHNRSAPPNPR